MGLCQWMPPIVPPALASLGDHKRFPVRASRALNAPLASMKTRPLTTGDVPCTSEVQRRSSRLRQASSVASAYAVTRRRQKAEIHRRFFRRVARHRRRREELTRELEVLQRPAGDPYLGWKTVCEDVELQRIPGNHLTSVSLHTEVVAERLKKILGDA